MKGRKMMAGFSYISPQYIQEAEFDAISGEASSEKKTGRLKIWLIAALVATMLFLTGAAVYTRWSSTVQARYHPTEEIKKQAQDSGLSVMVQETKAAENPGEVLSVTDQGITVSLVQTVVDEYGADLIFRIQGFVLPEGRAPAVWPETFLEGSDEDFYSSQTGTFYDGTTRNAQGAWVYTDGTPVQMDEKGDSILRFAADDGTLEYTHHITFQKTDGRYFGKEIQITFPYIGIQSLQKAGEFEPVVEGDWTLKWELTGTHRSINCTLNAEIGDTGVILLDAEIGQKTIRTRYKIPALWDGWDQLTELPEAICGVRMEGGAQYTCVPRTSGFEDQENMIYFVESEMVDAILDPNQVESLLSLKGRSVDATGKPIKEYYEISVK